MSDHECLENLTLQSHEWYETHGLDCGPYEHFYQEWWKCSVCGEVFSQRDLEASNAPSSR